MLKVHPVVEGYQEIQAEMRRLVMESTTGGELHTQLLGIASTTIFDSVLPFVPVVTGTLQAAQTIYMEPNGREDEAWLTAASLENPIFGGIASEYQHEVHPRYEYYPSALHEAGQLLEDDVYELVKAWLLI